MGFTHSVHGNFAMIRCNPENAVHVVAGSPQALFTFAMDIEMEVSETMKVYCYVDGLASDDVDVIGRRFAGHLVART